MSSVPLPSKPFIRPTTAMDIMGLSLTMREEDRMEVFHSSRGTPLDALVKGVGLSSEVFTIEKHGLPVAIFGVIGTPGAGGCPWMLGTDELPHCKSLLRECREIVQRYTKEYRYLTNACWSKNDVHIEWIKWLGFTFEGSDIRNGETFLHFHKESPCVNPQP